MAAMLFMEIWVNALKQVTSKGQYKKVIYSGF